ncbi:hypothetical protein Ancab_011394 [Ancistrocladus abbreviatus]
MAFECQESTEIRLSKNSTNLVHNNSLKERVGSFKLKEEESVNRQEKNFATADKFEESETLKLGCGGGTGVASGLKLVITNGSSPGCCRSITDLPSALILEILNCLDPKELGIVSCVSTSLYKFASDHYVWKDFYCERWGLPIVKPLASGLSDEKSWKELFVEREFRSKTFLGQYRRDFLCGHTDAVRTVFILASAKLVFTSGYDSIVRMWDMEEGSSIASSRPLGCTIRAVAADTKLLIAGGTDGFIQCWRAVDGLPYLFDLKGSQCQNSEFRLWEHEGPITSLALDITRIYSGSWDMTIRVWDRTVLKCMMVLRHSDWVWSLAPHDTTVASSSGSDVYVWDTSDKTLIAIIPHAHVGNAYALARSHTGDFLFTGGEDGSIHMFEISNCMEDGVFKVATWIPHSGSVHSLAFEFPWLVSASSDGKLSLIDVRKLLKNSRHSVMKHYSRRKHMDASIIEPPQRMLHGSGSSLFSVDIGADRVVCGGEECTVKVWDFSQALEKEQRSRAQRGIRLENRMRQQKLQFEMNSKGGRTERCSVVAKKNAINGDRVWHNKRGVSGKLKA